MGRHAVEEQHVPLRKGAAGPFKGVGNCQSPGSQGRLEIINASPMRPSGHLQPTHRRRQIVEWEPRRIGFSRALNRDEVLMRWRGKGFALGKDGATDEAGMRQHRAVEQLFEQADERGVMLQGVEFGHRVHPAIDIHILGRRLDAEAVLVGDGILQRRVGLNPASIASNGQKAQPKRFEFVGGQQAADKEMAVPLHAVAERGWVVDDEGRVDKGRHNEGSQNREEC